MKWTELEKADKASESLNFMAKRAVQIIIETNLKGSLNLKSKANKHLFYQISSKKLIFILAKLEQAKFIYIEPIFIYIEPIKKLAEKTIKSNLFLLLEDEFDPCYFSPEIRAINEINSGLFGLSNKCLIFKDLYGYELVPIELVPTNKLLLFSSIDEVYLMQD